MTTPSIPTTEPTAVVVDADGAVVNVIVLHPEDVVEYERALHREAQGRGQVGPGVRALSADEVRRGIGIGWRRSANGRFVDDRPAPVDPPAPAAAPTQPQPRP